MKMVSGQTETIKGDTKSGNEQYTMSLATIILSMGNILQSESFIHDL